MPKRLCLAVICCIIISCHSTTEDKIEVSGHASMKVVPDMVELSLKATSVRPAMKDAVSATQSAINEILIVCRKYIPAEQDIKVSHIGTDKSYDYNGNRQTFKGYSARQVLEVRLKDIRQLEKFSEELLATEITSIDNVQYNHSNADSIRRVVNLLALADAKMTAEKMCAEMNVTLDKVIYLSNHSPAGTQLSSMHEGYGNYELNLYNKSFGGSGFKMSAQILEFTDAAFAGFSIKH